MKKVLLVVCTAVCLVCVWAFVNTGVNHTPDEDEKVVVMRNVGHRVLLQSGDATSTLLPVKKLAEKSYQLQFKQPIRFTADSLVQTIHGQLARAGLGNKYLVKVTNTNTNEVTYTYSVTQSPEASNIPCIGRDQVVAPYTITITMGRPGMLAGLSTSYLLSGAGLALSLLALAMAGIKRKPVKLVNVLPATVDKTSIGQYEFFSASGLLKYKGTDIHLTAKEAKVLALFAARPNNTIERQELVKHIWEDEGVVTGGRSLDVFISKLRKKLNNDPAVTITNVHGLGYKLIIN